LRRRRRGLLRRGRLVRSWDQVLYVRAAVRFPPTSRGRVRVGVRSLCSRQRLLDLCTPIPTFPLQGGRSPSERELGSDQMSASASFPCSSSQARRAAASPLPISMLKRDSDAV